jgi:phytoene dehydrogenase-like protein
MLGDRPAIRHLDPGMVCHLPDGTSLVRYANREQWIAECQRVFTGGRQREFWNEVFDVSDRAWSLSATNPSFPPKSIGDVLGMARGSNLRNLELLRYIRMPVLQRLRHYGLDVDAQFRAFIDQQLMITAQNTAGDTPFLVGAMGLTYPGDTWYPVGGMYSVADYLEGHIRRNGGRILTKRRVSSIGRDGSHWKVLTDRGEAYHAPTVVSNVMIHDMPELIQSSGAYFDTMAEELGEGWGALTFYCAVRDGFNDHGSLYHQIHTDRIPYGGSESIFVSLSHPDDRLRAPEGWRTVSVSVHVAQPWRWIDPDGSMKPGSSRNAPPPRDPIYTELGIGYEDRKAELQQAILSIIDHALPGFGECEKQFMLTATPRTFGYYTRRRHGMVGGIPHSVGRNIFRFPKHRTPLQGLYMVGDTVYPGQGVPAVVLGAINLVHETT